MRKDATTSLNFGKRSGEKIEDIGRALTPSEDALNNILVENCTFVNPRGYLFAARNGSNMTFRGNKAEWSSACEKLPYAGKTSVTGGRDNVVADCP